MKDTKRYNEIVRLVDLQAKLNMLKAVSNRTRMEILILLTKEGPMPYTELLKTFDLNSSTIAEHLKVLERAGLVVNDYFKNPKYQGCHSFYMATEKGKSLLKSLDI